MKHSFETNKYQKQHFLITGSVGDEGHVSQISSCRNLIRENRDAETCGSLLAVILVSALGVIDSIWNEKSMSDPGKAYLSV